MIQNLNIQKVVRDPASQTFCPRNIFHHDGGEEKDKSLPGLIYVHWRGVRILVNSILFEITVSLYDPGHFFFPTTHTFSPRNLACGKIDLACGKIDLVGGKIDLAMRNFGSWENYFGRWGN